MKNLRAWSLAAMAAALMVACGGNEPYVAGSGDTAGAPTTKGAFTSVVSFGDSLSDAGTYVWATSIAGDGSPPYLGGKWTTNTTPQSATIWVENLAMGIGLIVTPAEIGFAGVSSACPAANATCTAYGQGGAMVTNPIGIGHTGGALTVPVKTQIERHLARFTRFGAGDLIFVWGGNNEVFAYFETFANAAAAIMAQAAAGTITADQAKAALLSAQLDALGKMKTAALDEAAYVKSKILAQGGRYVAVVNVPDFMDTPYGTGLAANPQTAALAPMLTALPANFNLWLREGLTDQPVKIIDAWSLIKQIRARPGDFGLLNVTTPTCNFQAQDVILGRVLSSGRALFCNVTVGQPFNMMADAGADPSTWLFADDAHPSTGGHRVIAQEFAKQLRAFGWLN